MAGARSWIGGFAAPAGEAAFTIGLIETNLLGTASTAAVRYRKDPDRSSVALLFRRPRLFAGTVGLGLQYENRSDGRIGAVSVERPFFSLTSPRAFRFDAEDHDERVLRFFNGFDLAARHPATQVHPGPRLRGMGGPRLVVRLPAARRRGQVRRDDPCEPDRPGPFPRR